LGREQARCRLNKTVEYYLGLPYSVELRQAPGEGWFARVREWPGCMTESDTAEQALANLKEVIPLWLEGALESGYEIPEPQATEYSGRFMVRVPRSLHADLTKRAEREGVSLNQLVNVALALLLGQYVAPLAQTATTSGRTRAPPDPSSRRAEKREMRVLKEDKEVYRTDAGGKYAPLHRHLAGLPPSEKRTSLTFDALEQIIGADLPPSARTHRAWWSNDRSSHIQADAWLAAGWKVDGIDRSTETVHFARS
jgi:antitoxin HicB